MPCDLEKGRRNLESIQPFLIVESRDQNPCWMPPITLAGHAERKFVRARLGNMFPFVNQSICDVSRGHTPTYRIHARCHATRKQCRKLDLTLPGPCTGTGERPATLRGSMQSASPASNLAEKLDKIRGIFVLFRFFCFHFAV